MIRVTVSWGVHMYADDLILISSSVSEMQLTMINVCSAELSNLDLTINANNSACIVIQRYQQNCSVLTVDSIINPWSSVWNYT